MDGSSPKLRRFKEGQCIGHCNGGDKCLRLQLEPGNLSTDNAAAQVPIIVIIVIRSLPFMRRRCEGAFSKSGIILCAGEGGKGWDVTLWLQQNSFSMKQPLFPAALQTVLKKYNTM